MLRKKLFVKSAYVVGLLIFFSSFAGCAKKDFLTDPLTAENNIEYVQQNDSLGIIKSTSSIERFPLYYDNNSLFWPSYLSVSEIDVGVRFHVYYKRLSTEHFSKIGTVSDSTYPLSKPYFDGYYFVLKGVEKQPALAASYFYPHTPEGFDERIFLVKPETSPQSKPVDPLVGLPIIKQDLDY